MIKSWNTKFSTSRIRQHVRFYIIFLIIGNLYALNTKYTGEFLKIGIGVRELSLGGAVTSSPRSVSAMYWNSSVLALNSKISAQFSHFEEFGGVLYFDQVSFAVPIKHGYAYGIGFFRLGVDDISDTRHALIDAGTDGLSPGDANYPGPDAGEGNGRLDPGERLNFGKIGTFGASENALYFSIAKKKSENLFFGLTIKQVIRSYSMTYAWGMGLDFSALYKTRQNLVIGLSLNDLTTTFLFWKDGEKEVVLPSVRTGVSYPVNLEFAALKLEPSVGLDIGFEGEQHQTDLQTGIVTGRVRLGLEATIKKVVCIRLGRDDLGATQVGLGLDLPAGSLDYGLAMGGAYSAIGKSHRLGLTLHWDELKNILSKIY